MWREILVPTTPGLMRAYTHANEGVIFAVTESGLYGLRLNDPVWRFIAERVTDAMLFDDALLTYDPYGTFSYNECVYVIHGYPTDDSEGCSDVPLGTHPPTGDQLDYDADCDTLTVRDAQGENVILSVYPFGASEEAWATAGFSNDGMHLTIANLERILVFVFVQCKDRLA